MRAIGRWIGGLDMMPGELGDLAVRVPDREHSNSYVVFGDRLVLKLFRRLEEGVNPELEIGEHLVARGITAVAPLAGAIELVGSGSRRTLAVVMGYALTRRMPGTRFWIMPNASSRGWRR